MRIRATLSVLGFCAAATCLAAGALVSGRIVDAATGETIPGARIEVMGSELGADSGDDGRFELALPALPSRARVFATGYEPRVIRLRGEFVEVLLKPAAGAVFRDSITIAAPPARPGDRMRDGVSLSDAMLRRQPDTSAAEALQRVAGAIVERDKGEADRIVLRGAESRLVATSLDGERLASPDGDVRSAGIGLVPTELLEEVRVSKTLTPDMDGDAIGGLVDLVTRKAPAAGIRSVNVSGGWDSESEKRLRSGGFVIGDRFGDNRLGVLLSTSRQDAGRGADRLEARYDPDDPREIERVELRDYDLIRARKGVASVVDFAPNEATDIRANGFWSSLATDELRRRAKFDYADGEIERELKDAHLERQIASATIGGSHLLRSGLELDFKVGAQRASQNEPDRVDTSFLQEDLAFDPTGLSPVSAAESVAQFRLDKIGVENNATHEDNVFAALNIRVPVAFSAATSGIFKAGLKVRDKSKVRDSDTTVFEPRDDLFLSSFLGSGISQNGFLNGRYDVGPIVDPRQARGLIDRFDLEGRLSFEEEAADYRAGERTSAAYVMSELMLSRRFSLLPGVRYERTVSDYHGFEVIAAELPQRSSVRDLSGDQDYGLWLPGIHATFSAHDNLVFRGAVTRSLARPDYFDLVPYRIFDFEDAELVLGNGGLRPTTSWNVDLGMEWHTGDATDLSFSVFYKKMADFIYTERGIQDVGGEVFDVTRPTNGHHATLRGVEISLRHAFGSAAGPLEGLAVEMNFTGTDSSAEVDRSEVSSFRLPGQAPHSGQLLLSYDRARLFGNLSATHVSQYLLELGGTRVDDVYLASQLRLDFATGYTVTDRTRIFLHLNHVTDEPIRMFQGSPNRIFRLEQTGRSARAGLKIRF